MRLSEECRWLLGTVLGVSPEPRDWLNRNIHRFSRQNLWLEFVLDESIYSDGIHSLQKSVLSKTREASN